MTKAALRKAALAARAATRDATRQTAAQARLRELLWPHRGKPMAGYLPMRDEIDPSPVLAEFARHGPVGMPVTPPGGAALVFRRWAPTTPLETGRFGTRHPASGPMITPEILVVPLVGFDRKGNRLGYGGGYYDRTLAGLPQARSIGFAYAAQELDGIPTEPTDVALGLIVTENEILGPF